MLNRTGVRFSFFPTANLRKVELVKVPLRMAENEIAVIRLVQLNYQANNPQKNATLVLSSRNDLVLPGTDDEADRLLQELFQSDGTVAVMSLNDDAASSQVLPLDPGYPVVGDMTLLIDAEPTVTEAQTPHIQAVSVYYDKKKVSAAEWLKFAKKSRNAPADRMPFSVFNS